MAQQNQQATDLQVRQVVARIVASKGFASSPRLAEFLRYVAEETIAGRADDIKEYVIGVAVYKKDPNYNPSTDSTVRTEASRLRSRLQAYYAEEGTSETVRVAMPKGGYTLKWEESAPAVADPVAPAPAPTPTVVSPAPRQGSRIPAWVLPAAVASLVTAGLLWWTTVRPGPDVPVHRMRPFTSFPGGEYEPAFSPDGQKIAFIWNGPNEDNFDVYVMGLDQHQPERITDHAGGDVSPAWSPDGKQLAYLRHTSTEAGLYVMDLATRQERKVCPTKLTTALHDRHLDWSPDGKQLALADHEAEGQPYFIDIVDIGNGQRRRLTSPSGQTLGDAGPAFSPDGRFVAFRRAMSDAVREILLVPVNGGEPLPLTRDQRHISAHAWAADGKTILFVSRRDGASRIWRVEPRKDARPTGPLPFGQDAYFLAVARTGGRIVFSQNVLESSIWRLPLQKPERGERFIHSTRAEASAQYSPAGDKIVFRSERSGTAEIWLWSDGGKSVKALTHFKGPLTGSPRWAPDGRRIVFDSRPSGTGDIFSMPVEGGEPVRITVSPADDVLPCYSMDGRSIFFASNRSGTWQVWNLPVGVLESPQNPATQVTADGGFAPQAAPGGEELYYAKHGVPGIWRVPVNGGREQAVQAQSAQGLWGWWAPRGTSLFHFAPVPGAPGSVTLEQMTPGGGPARTLARLTERPLPWDSGFSLSPDGAYLIYSRVDRDGSDLILAEQPDPPVR